MTQDQYFFAGFAVWLISGFVACAFEVWCERNLTVGDLILCLFLGCIFGVSLPVFAVGERIPWRRIFNPTRVVLKARKRKTERTA